VVGVNHDKEHQLHESIVAHAEGNGAIPMATLLVGTRLGAARGGMHSTYSTPVGAHV
jgi:hypothetical protein